MKSSSVMIVGWIVAITIVVGLSVTFSRLIGSASVALGPWAPAWAKLRNDGRVRLAIVVLLTVLVLALLAPLLSPYDPSAQPDIVTMKSQSPSWSHPFGTDEFSRDVFSRILFGARVSLAVGVLSVLVSATLGTAFGAIAGMARPSVDSVMMRIVEAGLSMPRVLLLLGVLALWGHVQIWAMILLIGATGWFGTSRLVRAQVRSLMSRDFVTAARALGVSESRLLLRHILPNALSVVVIAATLAVGNVIVLEAGLSYLNVGVPQPTPSWGNIIQDGAEIVSSAWWISVFPGLAIVFTVLAINALGDALRDALDPRT